MFRFNVRRLNSLDLDVVLEHRGGGGRLLLPLLIKFFLRLRQNLRLLLRVSHRTHLISKFHKLLIGRSFCLDALVHVTLVHLISFFLKILCNLFLYR